MNQNKILNFLDKVVRQDTKITVATELDHWYGQTLTGEKVQITDITMLEIIELGFGNKELAKLAESRNFLTLPDGARFGKTILALRKNGLIELATELTSFAKQQNLANGFEDCNPEEFDSEEDVNNGPFDNEEPIQLHLPI